MLAKGSGQQLFARLYVSYLHALTFLISVDIISFNFEGKRETKKVYFASGTLKTKPKQIKKFKTHLPGIELRSVHSKSDALTTLLLRGRECR